MLSLNEIKMLIDKAKDDKAKAEGAIEQILKKWKEEFNITSKEEAEKIIKDQKDKLSCITKKYNILGTSHPPNPQVTRLHLVNIPPILHTIFPVRD